MKNAEKEKHTKEVLQDYQKERQAQLGQIATMASKQLGRKVKTTTAYHIFVKEMTPVIRERDKSLQPKEVVKAVSEEWKKVTASEKLRLQKLADQKTNEEIALRTGIQIPSEAPPQKQFEDSSVDEEPANEDNYKPKYIKPTQIKEQQQSSILSYPKKTEGKQAPAPRKIAIAPSPLKKSKRMVKGRMAGIEESVDEEDSDNEHQQRMQALIKSIASKN